MSSPDDSIQIHPATGTVGKGNWQAIGHYKGQHIAAFGFSPQDALDKAMAIFNLCEDEGCPNHGTAHVCVTKQEEEPDVFG